MEVHADSTLKHISYLHFASSPPFSIFWVKRLLVLLSVISSMRQHLMVVEFHPFVIAAHLLFFCCAAVAVEAFCRYNFRCYVQCQGCTTSLRMVVRMRTITLRTEGIYPSTYAVVLCLHDFMLRISEILVNLHGCVMAFYIHLAC